MKYFIVFICQKGELEIKSALLVYSILENVSGNYEIIACIPSNNKNEHAPSQELLDILRQNSIKIVTFENKYIELRNVIQSSDWISNKIYSLFNIEGDRILFMDSDIFCLRSFSIHVFDSIQSLGLKEANRSNNINWPEIYKIADVEFPKNRIKCLLDKKLVPPYFNSGVILIDKAIKKLLLNNWQKYYRLLSDYKLIEKKYYDEFFRDQIALALAINKYKIPFTLISEKYNFPIRGLPIDFSDSPYLLHFHSPYTLYFNKPLREMLLDYLNTKYGLLQLVNNNRLWHSLFIGRFFQKKIVLFEYFLTKTKNRLIRFLLNK